jgi:predicted amidophosphoribosyltransferase
MNDPANEKWNENIETCSDCGIHWKKIGKSCPVCYAPAEQSTREQKELPKRK